MRTIVGTALVGVGAAAVLTGSASPALAAAPERIEGGFSVVAGPGPVDCRALGYDFDVLQTGEVTFHGLLKDDGTRMRQVTATGTVWRADMPETTYTYTGRALVVDTPDGQRRLSGQLRQYRDEDGRIVVKRAGRQVVTFGSDAVELVTTPKAGVEDEQVCALLAG